MAGSRGHPRGAESSLQLVAPRETATWLYSDKEISSANDQWAWIETPHTQVKTAALTRHPDSCQASPTPTSASGRTRKCRTRTSEHRNCEVTNTYCLNLRTFWWFVPQREKANTALSEGFEIAKINFTVKNLFLSMLPEPGHTNPFVLKNQFSWNARW